MAKTKTVVTVISKISERPVDNAAALVVIYGTDLGKKYDLNRPETVIGRSSKADIMVDQESISRNHAALTNKGGAISIRDMGSTNGTYLGEEQITEAHLENQAEFTVGGSTLMLIITRTGP